MDKKIEYTFDPVAAGKRLVKFRKGLGFSQKAFAEKIRLHNSDLSKLEKGNYSLSFNLLLKIIGASGASPSWILFGVGPESLADSEFLSGMDDGLVDFLKRLGAMPGERRGKILEGFGKMMEVFEEEL
ncbi:MAG: helix-turn-helix transcriptional regulator [bacterium]|nr:helix-turn-helix transcriptional regulator [bacterium]